MPDHAIMRHMKNKAKKLLQKVKSYFPTVLPQTDSEFAEFSAEIMQLADMPNNDSFVQAIGTMVLHLGPSVATKSKHFFVKSLRASVAKQAAFNACDAIRQREKSAKTIQGIDTTVVQQA